MRTSTRADSGLTLTRPFDMENENIYKSKKNANVYHIFDEKIVVKTPHGDKEIPLPVDPMSFKYYVSFFHGKGRQHAKKKSFFVICILFWLFSAEN